MFNDQTLQGQGRADAIAYETAEARADFLRKTYLHLAGAIGVFVAIIAAFISTGIAERITITVMGGRWSWLIVLGAFMVASHVANKFAYDATSIGKQYFGLGLYVVAEALIMTPLIYIAATHPAFEGHHLLRNAAWWTLGIFGAITAIVFITGKDFSFLRGAMMLGGIIAAGLIVCSIIFGFTLGLGFSIGMAAFAGMACLYSTSNVMHHYRNSQHVAASLALFAAIALLFWYVLRILMSLANRD